MENKNRKSKKRKASELENEKTLKQPKIDGNVEEELEKMETDEDLNLDGKSFRNALNSDNKYGALQRFIKVCRSDEGKQLACNYLKVGGNVLEVLRVLDSSDKKNIGNAQLVFSAMRILILKILELDNGAAYRSQTEEACRHFINVYLPVIHSMLSSQSNVKHKKVALRLLAAIVSLGGTLPCELLNHMSLHAQLIDSLVQPNRPTDSESVRVCFIQFVLAFLVEGDAPVIRALLDKHGVLSSIFPDLLYDYAEMVHMIFFTVNKWVLKNPHISKTLKLHIFSTPVVKSIVNLYNWKGPSNWPGIGKNKKTVSSENVNSEDKKIATDAVHEFLLTLLTHKKHGIAFLDRSLGSDSAQKHNKLINTVLQAIEKPWESEKPSDLIVKILTACPDLIKPQLTCMEPLMVPRVSKNWIQLIGFLKKIIYCIDTKNIKRSAENLPATQLANAVLQIVLPPIIFKKCVNPVFEQDNVILQHAVIELLATMLNKTKDCVKIVRETKYSKTELGIFEMTVSEVITKRLPDFEMILKVWVDNLSLKEENSELSVDVGCRLLSILNLLELYSEICPEILQIPSGDDDDTESKSAVLLTSLNIPDIEQKKLNFIRIKAIKILLRSDPSLFAADKKIYRTALSFLISSIGTENSEISSEVIKILNILFIESGLFEGCTEEIEIWINSLVYLENSSDREAIADWIVKIVKRTSKNMEKYVSLVRKMEENIEEQSFKSETKDIFEELSEKDFSELNLLSQTQSDIKVSLLLYAALENLQKTSSDAIINYVSRILVHSLHIQLQPRPLILLTKDLSILTRSYLDTFQNLKEPFEKEGIFRYVAKLFQSKKDIEIFVDGNSLIFKKGNDTCEFSLTDFEVKALLNMTLFHLCQNLDSKSSIYRLMVLRLMELSKHFKHIDDCLKLIFTNPMLLHNFEGVGNKDEETNEVTKLISEVCEKYETSFLREPWKRKFIRDVKLAVTKNFGNKEREDFKIRVELFSSLGLENGEAMELLSDVMRLKKEQFLERDKSKFSDWGRAVPKLINVTCQSDSSYEKDINLMKKIFYYLCEIKLECSKQSFVEWENALYTYLRRNPHAVSAVDTNMFCRLLNSSLSETTIEIIVFYTQLNEKYLNAFVQNLKSCEDMNAKKILIFSGISSYLNHEWDKELLKKIGNVFKKEIEQFLTEPEQTVHSQWILKYADAVVIIIQDCFDMKTCEIIREKLPHNVDQLETISIDYIKLCDVIFKKCDASFTHVLLPFVSKMLQNKAKTLEEVKFTCQKIVDAVYDVRSESKDVNFCENESWLDFVEIALKVSLEDYKSQAELASYLLGTLAIICEAIYDNGIGKNQTKMIFQLITDHTEYKKIMLDNSSIKGDLVNLLWVLVKKNSKIVSIKHIPVYLASYGASLSKVDKLLLQIMQYYENKGINFEDYKQCFWGSSAALHYSVKSEAGTALLRQPTVSRLLDQFDPEMVMNTVSNFPASRTFRFKNFHTVSDKAYDPVFYLPLFITLLESHNVVPCSKFIRSGALAISLVACSSEYEEIRLAAQTVIAKFHFHLEGTRSPEKQIWINFLESLRKGIAATDLPLKEVRLNGFVSMFLARASLIMTQPVHPLYSPIQSFLIAKPILDLNTIPEFLKLFHSSEVNYRIDRNWILEVVRDGFMIQDDVEVAMKCALFKMLFSFYRCSLADKESKLLILQTLRSVTELPKACIILVNNYSLLPWLLESAENLKKTERQSVDCTVDTINNILITFCTLDVKNANSEIVLSKILKELKPHFYDDFESKSYKNFIQALNSVPEN